MPPVREEDSEGKLGITIHNDELQVFGEVLEFNVTILAYLEAKEMVKKGDEVWLLGIGTGPRCCGLVWECLRPAHLWGVQFRTTG
ncbi:hypothetical protein DKX38_023147 [Salix brachista]|uniref:Uncharacterized protein n=1 Tax=Salix brachista TaxID=2182728 RepID=A0A5N5K1M6_9ROSI|nr:hypothetical protein DKX38_023147 [Salix brachista]